MAGWHPARVHGPPREVQSSATGRGLHVTTHSLPHGRTLFTFAFDSIRMPDSDDGNTDADATYHTEDHRENDGRSVKIDTGFCAVQVLGDPEDDFGAVMGKALRPADCAKDDAKALDGRLDDDGRQYR